MGYVLQRGQLCFHAMFAGAWHGRFLLLRGWALAVALGSVGLAVLYLTPLGADLNTGLAFRPVANVIGGLLIGWGNDATIPGLLGLPRLLVAAVVLAAIIGLLWRTRRRVDGGARERWQWNWPTLGIGLGLILVLGWLLAAIGGVDFGPSTVGASAGAVAGDPRLDLRGLHLGHGLSGMAQLNISSIVVVACMALGVGHARAMFRPEKRQDSTRRGG